MPILRRLSWHLSRARERIDRRLIAALVGSLLAFIAGAAVLVTLVEGPVTLGQFGDAFYWALNTVLGAGDPGFVSSFVGRTLSSALILVGLTLLALASGLVIGFIVDVLLKEGHGMGASGYRDHIVVCGWNSSARELIDELRSDEYRTEIVLVCGADRSPAPRDVYFVNGDPTAEEDLIRAGIREASSAVVFPNAPTDEADMRSILTVMAIESIAPEVRTVVEVNNPRNATHLRRAHADEVLPTSQLTAHLLARSSMYPGMTELVMDLVSGGEGAELYRCRLPEAFTGRSIQDLAGELFGQHRATLLALVRDGESRVNPPGDETIVEGDEALLVAESLKTLESLGFRHA